MLVGAGTGLWVGAGVGCEVGSIDIVGSPVGSPVGEEEGFGLVGTSEGNGVGPGEGRDVGEGVYEMLKAGAETFSLRAKVLRRVHAHVTLVVV